MFELTTKLLIYGGVGAVVVWDWAVINQQGLAVQRNAAGDGDLRGLNPLGSLMA